MPDGVPVDPFASLGQWAALHPAEDVQAFIELLQRLERTNDGLALFHTLAKYYVMDNTPGISAERQLGREDVIKDIWRMLRAGRELGAQSAHITGTG